VLTAISFSFEALKTGATCNGDVAPVILVLTMTTLFTLLTVALIALLNPLIAFAAGVVLDRDFNWFIGQAKNCK
jgi:hypothetical protein